MRAGLERYLHRVWQSPRPPLYLRLLSGVYRGLSRSRWTRPDESSPFPVIVVGNVTAGGSGKTPVVAAAARWLQQGGHAPAVISRGYGGRTASQPRPVTADSDPADVGDEAVLLARRAACPVWVCRDRRAALAAARSGGCDVVIADDGLQHPRLPRSFEICVIDGQRGLGNRYLLPAGPLRQPLDRLDSVDMILIKGPGDADLPGQSFHVEPGKPYRLGDDRPAGGSSIDRTIEYDAVCAIGNPDSFFQLLEALGYRFRPHAFPDHHAFSARDLSDLAGPLLVTEKDAVKLERLRDLPECWVVPIAARLPQDCLERLKRHVREFRPT